MCLKLFFILSFILNSFIISGFMDLDLALSFFQTEHLGYNVILTCLSKKERVKITKHLFTNKAMLVSLRQPKLLTTSNLVSGFKRTGFVLDSDCPDARILFRKLSNYRLFDSMHFWLILSSTNDSINIFKYVKLNVNANIKMIQPFDESNNQSYSIMNIYNPAYEKGGKLKISEVGLYEKQTGFNIYKPESKYNSRRDLSGVLFKTVVVLPESFEGTLKDYLLSDSHREINTFNRFHSRLMHYCRDYYNFSMDISLDKSWGYLQPDGTLDGLAGQFQQRKIDFGLSPLFVKKDRAEFISYGRKTWNLKAAFIFRNPKSRKSYQIFIKPLSLEVWICIVAVSNLLVLMQQLGYILIKKRSHSVSRKTDASWSFSTICTVGAFCQQGITSFPNLLSGRITALFTLLLGLLIYQFYSASLVSFLLNVPTTEISSVQELLNNKFKIGCEDVLYDKDILKYATDKVTRNVFKILNKNQSGFLKPEVGLRLVKNGEYAFHLELATGYPIIKREFEEKLFCELKEVPLFGVKHMHANYQKRSPFKDILDICLHRLSENGVIAREILFWHPRKPKCPTSRSNISINMGLEDFYPALAVLVIGIFFCVLILAIEILI